MQTLSDSHDLIDSPITRMADAAAAPSLERLIYLQLQMLGEDPTRAGLRCTPQRVAKSLTFLTSGYSQDARDAIDDAIFESDSDEMVVVEGIEFYSLCEHHMLPFFGHCHVSYLPAGKVVGLSKVARLIEVFARRLQVQERMTMQIAEGLAAAIPNKGVGVIVNAEHLCMKMRGVEKQNSHTITSAMLGRFRDDPKTRTEFLELISSFKR